ncbi:MAG: transporter substrate-binding domain-containing protein [Rhizobiales bacterium]|nr:transporter substrate-binding domain-containing protein [Hyphomicrobiales bacterium]
MADDRAALAQQLFPTGKLRVAIAVAPSPSAQFAIRDGAGYRGVAVMLGEALAKKLGVAAELVVYNGSGDVQNAAPRGEWDVAFMPVDEERKKFVDFGSAFHVLQSTYLVGAGKPLAKVADVNAPGVRVGAVANTATLRASSKSSSRATHVPFDTADKAVAALHDGTVDAIAFSRESLGGLQAKVPGSSILPDAFMNSTTSAALPKGKPLAVAYVSDFVEEAKASGLVRKAFDAMGLTTSQVAPPRAG